ncbi:Protein CHLOROPLAST IMPORT APPARATUS 2, partial [Mucuna pruriens]
MTSSWGRTYRFNLDFAKSSSTSTLTSPTSSPSSTTSEATNSTPQSIFTKKPRTLRKRPNQTYNEAATLLSAAYPNLFSTKNLKKPEKFTKPITEYNDSSEPLLLFRECDDDDAFSFLRESKRSFQTEPNKVFFGAPEKKPRESSAAVANYDELESEDFDCESMLDEETEEGIDSIMGGRVGDGDCGGERPSPWFGVGGKFGWVRALRRVDDANWWNFLVVDMLQISPRMNTATPASLVPETEKKKKKKKKEKKVVKKLPQVEVEVELSQGLLLKLNYDDVRNAWSDRGSPFAGGSPGNDAAVRLSSLAGSLKSKRKKV